MKFNELTEAKYVGPKNIHNLLQFFDERGELPGRTRYTPRDEVTIKNVVDDFDYEGEEVVKLLIIFHEREKVRVFYRDNDQTLSFKEAAERLAVFALKRIY